MEGQIKPVPVVTEPTLNDREKYALKIHLEKRDHPISPHTGIKLFELFLAGKSLEDIRRLNPQFTLGQLVHARIEGQWDQKLAEYTESLYETTKERLRQVTAETALTIANLLAAKNKVYQDRVLKFLQSGDEEYLRDLNLGGIDGYRKLVEVLQKLTGSDQTKTVKGEVIHRMEQPAPQIEVKTSTQAILEAVIEEHEGAA